MSIELFPQNRRHRLLPRTVALHRIARVQATDHAGIAMEEAPQVLRHQATPFASHIHQVISVFFWGGPPRPCGWGYLASAVKTGTWSALRLGLAFPTLCPHEGLAPPPRPSADNSRNASWTWRRQGRGCRQPADDAAAPGDQSVSATRTPSPRSRPLPLWLLGTVSRSSPYPAGGSDPSAVEAAAMSRGAEAAHVSAVVFIWQNRQAWPEGAGR